MSTPPKRRKSTPRSAVAGEATSPSKHAAGVAPSDGETRRMPSAEAEETLNAILAGQIDALVIQGGEADKLYAVRSFVEIQRTQLALENAGAARRRSEAQLKALAEERERLFQDMHDGCIQSIYAVGLNLEACLRLIDTNPTQTRQMIAESTASLNLVIQELRSFITGHRLRVTGGHDLRTAIEKAALAAGIHGLKFTVDVDETAMNALTPEQASHILQIAREGISNATRHAQARSGRISLQHRSDGIRLEVRDDGTGFNARTIDKLGLGLHHIKARARKLGGTARVTSAPNKGTRIIVQFGKL